MTAETISSINGNATIQYTFTSTANLAAFGAHTIEAWVDYPTDNYRHNDTTVIHLVNSALISSFPYLENFEAGNGLWYTGGVISSWEYGTPASNKINSAASGSKAWKTRLVGNYNDLEYSYLYSPCFDISGMTNPTLSFSVALDLEDCGTGLCDGAWVEYSTDGVTWNILGSFGSGTIWTIKIMREINCGTFKIIQDGMWPLRLCRQDCQVTAAVCYEFRSSRKPRRRCS